MPADTGAIFSDQPYINDPGPLSIKVIEFLYNSPVVAKTLDYGKKTLHAETFNHFMMVYYYGTAEENLTTTSMSFDIYGGIKAMYVLEDFGATADHAEAAAEAIIQHEDTGVDSTITLIGQPIELATTYDNTGFHPHVKYGSRSCSMRLRALTLTRLTRG